MSTDTADDILSSERRKAVVAETDCLRCGNSVELEAETEQWTEDEQGVWRHDGYGPGHGGCCGLVYIEQPFDGVVEVFEVPESAA